MDKAKVLEKIKKCLALSQSANENEAAQALKQAQALMRQYSITDIEVELSAVTETGVGSAASLPSWHQLLISRCAKAFGVECYLERCCGTAEVRFFGLGVKPELAAYAYEVLLRQLKKSRREYIKTELVRVRSASTPSSRRTSVGQLSMISANSWALHTQTSSSVSATTLAVRSPWSSSATSAEPCAMTTNWCPERPS